jgi:hypothetical protein
VKIQRRAIRITLLLLVSSLSLAGLLGSTLSVGNSVAASMNAPSQNYRVYLPLALKNYKAPPPASTSRYMSTPGFVYADGCAEAQAGRGNVVVVLDFGQPWYQNSTYGTKLFDDSHTFVSNDLIEAYAQGFMTGYWSGAMYIPSATHLTLAIGTSNFGAYTNYGHGQAWAGTISNLAEWISNCGSNCNYSSKISITGASDIEPGFNTVLISRTWADGYNAANTRPYYNYGSCDGCPYLFPGGGGCSQCIPSNGWKLEDIWYVSWGVLPAWPLPEIYNTTGANAYQWQNISLHGYTDHGSAMNIQGSFTQWWACQGRPCNGIDNTPGVGWLQLYGALNADSRTAQNLPWSTDITWDN